MDTCKVNQHRYVLLPAGWIGISRPGYGPLGKHVYWYGTRGHWILHTQAPSHESDSPICTFREMGQRRVAHPRMPLEADDLTIDTEKAAPTEFILHRYHLSSDKENTSKRTLPFQAEVLNSAFSSDNTQFALLLTRPLPSPVFSHVQSLSKGPTTPNRTELSLWVGHTAGGALREIGRLFFKQGANPAPDLSDLQWLPSGKRLSYICQNILYTVPSN